MKTKLIDLLGLTNMANDIRDWVNAHFQRKVDGKGLSTYDYDKTAKDKVDAIPNNPQYTDTQYTAGDGISIDDNVISATGGGGGGEENVIESITMNSASVPVTNKTAAITEIDPTVPSWAKQQTKPSYNYSEIGNTPDLSGFITKSVNDLTNYYLKSETYTQAEVEALIRAIQQFHYEIYPTLPQSGESNVLYLIGPTGSGSDRYEEYVYSNSVFTKIGDTSIDLSGYVTTSALNTALADYATTQDLDDSKVFWAEVDVTTFAEIQDAIDAGRTVMLKDEDGYIYVLFGIYDDFIMFTSASGEEAFIKSYSIYTNDVWDFYKIYNIESQDNKVTSISSSSGNGTYPSAKAVYDIVSTKYTKPSTGIPASDLASGVIPTVPVQDVTVGGTSVVSNGTAVIPQEVFWATYGTTTAAEIDAAVSVGKTVLVTYNNRLYLLSDIQSHKFSCVYNDYLYWISVDSQDSWSNSYYRAQNTSNRVSTISGYETDTTKYPNTKAVADALGKWGVISQTQTWSGTGTQPRTYVMSDLVYGTIPQANIDLFESAGATFNATTGYFELNGLTDISYEEMQKIYNNSIVAATYPVSRSMAFATPSSNFIIRCTLPLRTMTSFQTNFSYLCYRADVIEQVNIENSYISTTSSLIAAFQNAYCLKKIGNGYMDYIGGANDAAFKNCYSLESVHLRRLKANMNFNESPNLSMESIAYMVANAETDNITITLHPTAYNAAIVNTDVTAALQTKTNVSLASA